jgi:hypothetical protein
MILTLAGPAPSVTTICFDVEGGEEGAWSVVKTGILPIHEDIVRKVTLWSNFFGRQNRNRTADKKLADPPKFLAVVELNKSPTGDVSGQRSELSNEVTASFDLLKASGVGNSVSFE